MQWLFDATIWYVMLFLGGLIFLPLMRYLFGNFFRDAGYPFAKTVAILLVSYVIFVLSTMHVLAFSRLSLFLLIVIFGLINFFIFKKTKKIKTNWGLIFFEEGLFLLSFLLWVYVRSQEPSIHGLEKFMDFGFIQSALKTTYFPAKDIWLSGNSINYYYFGHLTAAVLIKISNIVSTSGYNLVLATIFAQGITSTFSIAFNLVDKAFKNNLKISIFAGILAAFILNFSGNLHPIYLFTSGYNPDTPVPFWEIFSGFDPGSYWYPNATRFIPFTIHEFPLYSYVVADLHGHVFGIPFVLFTLFLIFTYLLAKNKKLFLIPFGFMLAINYMTNAFDGGIYFLLIAFFSLVLFGLSFKYLLNMAVIIISFIIFSFPFSKFFAPFVSGIGVNCAPNFLVKYQKIGPFLFEKGNCQTSAPWMLFVLWGFFFFSFVFFSIILFKNDEGKNTKRLVPNIYVAISFIFSFFLILIPEFFYIKDIYPAHFRANTMFKLGYQAFIIMSIASAYVFVLIKQTCSIFEKTNIKNRALNYFLNFGFILLFAITALFPVYAISSYYGALNKTPQTKGDGWISEKYSEYKEIIDYLNKNIAGQPNILEAQGDSYTDYNVVSAYTGFPTVSGWYVHEWLWRGTPDVVAKRVPDIENIFESEDLELTKNLITKYKIKYIIIGKNEKEKYKSLKEEKFTKIGKRIFNSSNNSGAIYQVN